jgi:type IV pilus assembly protein PilC
MVGYAVPKISGFLRSMGRPLPAMTQWLVDFSAWVNAWLAWIVGGSLLAGALGAAVYVWRPGRLAVDRWTLRLPVLGGLLRLGATAAFSHALAILLRSGVTLLEALGTAEQLHHNRYLGVRLAAARDQVLRGGTLADALEPGHAYTPMLASMVAVGEASGSLDDILDEVARFHGSQLQSAIRRFSAIIEPVIIVVVGSIVGFVYVAFFLALFAGAGGVR